MGTTPSEATAGRHPREYGVPVCLAPSRRPSVATYRSCLTTAPRRGLTNDDSGFLEPNQEGSGTYSFRTYRRPEAVRILLHLTLSEIERIRSESVREEELFVAKGALADGVSAAQYRDGWSTADTIPDNPL